ncbi:hypothetical protein SBV1_1230011 [Verrucomicrobia bacterium]|nr:hypothetical protein SBV1_1230011 [Verrucomicrobiota bacterium]
MVCGISRGPKKGVPGPAYSPGAKRNSMGRGGHAATLTPGLLRNPPARGTGWPWDAS